MDRPRSGDDLGEWAVDAVAHDGGVVRIRPLVGDDIEALRRFSDGLSERTLHDRFFSTHRPGGAEIAAAVDIDHDRHHAVVAEHEDEIIGIATYDWETTRGSAEVAFTVADAHQDRGLGTLLLEHLAAYARSRGITRFHAETLGDNVRMLRVFELAGFRVSRALEGGIWDVAIDISTIDPDSVSAREHDADAASIEPILQPRSVAVVGASRREDSIGHAVLRNLLNGGYEGTVHPVNRSAESVLGVRTYPSVGEIDEAVDLAVVAVPAPDVIGVIDDCAAAGVPAVLVISAGFAETGPEGARLESELAERVRRHGMRMIGPNSMGLVSTAPGVRLAATFSPKQPLPGSVALASQSGTLAVAIFDRAREQGLGFSSFVSLGNKADVSSNDLLQWWEDDPNTRVILLYVESFGNPRKFSRISRRIGRTKPIVAVKGGHSGPRSGTPSTIGERITNDDLAETLFRQAGIIRVPTLEQLVEVARVLDNQPIPAGRRVAIVGNSGGPIILAADACLGAGLDVHHLGEEAVAALREALPDAPDVTNPVDLGRAASPAHYQVALEHVLADNRTDTVIVVYTDPLAGDHEAVADAIRTASTARPDKTVLACFLAGDLGAVIPTVDGRAVPVFDFPESPAVALGLIAAHVAWRHRPLGEVPDLDRVDAADARRLAASAHTEHGDRRLPGAVLRDLLRTVGIEVAPEVLPLAGDPVGVECALGVVSDRTFGPHVVFTLGSHLGEGEERSLATVPLTDIDAAELIAAPTAAAGPRKRDLWRGADTDHLAELVHRVSALADAVPELVELELAPVLVSADRITVLAARGRLASTSGGPDQGLRRLRATRTPGT
ncbi:MAG: GNAT family N-acetyltransferase [Acidimicrobiales bacterium]